MKNKQYLKEDELLKKAFSILLNKIGPAELNRFIAVLKERKKDSVKRHRLWQDSLNKNDFFDEIFMPQKTKKA
jgi:hypothetical protein